MKINNNTENNDYQTFLAAVQEACASGTEEVNKKNENGNTLLHEALEGLLKSKYTSEEAIKSIKILLESGADIEAKNKNGFTPLTLAVQYRDNEVVDALLKLGANPNGFIGHNEIKMVHIAMYRFHKEIFANLLSKGMTVDEKDKYGNLGHTFDFDGLEDHFLCGLLEMYKLIESNNDWHNKIIGNNIRNKWAGIIFDEKTKSAIVESLEKKLSSSSEFQDNFSKNFTQIYDETLSYNQTASEVKSENLFYGITKIPTADLSFLSKFTSHYNYSGNSVSLDEQPPEATLVGDNEAHSDLN